MQYFNPHDLICNEIKNHQISIVKVRKMADDMHLLLENHVIMFASSTNI